MWSKNMTLISNFIKNESGASAIEYSLLAAMMASAIVAATTTFKTDLGKAFSNIGAKLKTNT
jgi:pilus assembly protein Flp/PilA